MTRQFKTVLFAAMLSQGIATGVVSAQDGDCGCGVITHRVECRTVYEQQPVTTYRLQTETTLEERQITSQRPVTETSYRERRYTVARPVTETAYREEQYTVMRPVRETEYRDASYDRVRYVTETSSRTERRVVSRPVTETQYREEQYVVQRPVVQTMYQDQVQTALVPVTSYRQQVVDQGQVYDQQTYVPGPTRNRLRWLGGQCYTDPMTGRTDYRRMGLYWVPNQLPGTYQTQRVYVPNPTLQQVAETSLVPQQFTQKVPVQVTQMQNEVQVRQVPVSVVRMEQEEQFRQVPVSVQRPITERVEQKIPVTVCRWEPQTMVRRVPVTTQRMQYEEKVEQIPVQTCRMVTEVRKVQVPVTRSHWVGETSTRLVAKRVYVRTPIDACGGTVLDSAADSVLMESSASVVPGTSSVVSEPQPTPAGAANTRPSLKPDISDKNMEPLPQTTESLRPEIDADASNNGARQDEKAPWFQLSGKRAS